MPANLFDLSGKVAVITGGGTGLGRGMAEGLADAGALVVLAGRRHDVVDRAAAEIRSSGGKAEGVALDVTRVSELPTFFEGIVKRHGALDILVNNADTNRRNPALEYTEQDLVTVVNLNLKSLFFCCQAAARIMKERGGGKIINTASLSSAIASTNQSAYSPSKAGVRMLTMQLAFELAPHRINVNAIGPGWFRTPSWSTSCLKRSSWLRRVESRVSSVP